MSSENFNREEICSGCFSYVDPGKMKGMVDQTWTYGANKSKIEINLQCSIKAVRNGINCPCSICLIKMVCDTTCDKIDEYLGDVFKIGGHY